MRGALWAIGGLFAAGGIGFGALSYMAAAMSDSPSGSADEIASALPICGGVTALGLAMIGAGFWF